MQILSTYITRFKTQDILFLSMFSFLSIGCVFGNINAFIDPEINSKWFWYYIVVFIISIVTCLYTWKKPVKLTYNDYIILFLLFITIISTIVRNSFNIDFILVWFSTLLLYFLFRQMLSEGVIPFIFSIIILICFIEALYGAGKYIFIHQRIVSGSFDNPAGYASCLIVGMGCCLYFFQSKKKSVKFISNVLFILFMFLIILSESRTGILSGITLAAFYILISNRLILLRWKKKLLVIVLFLVFVSGTLYFFKKDSADGRLLIWRCTWDMIKEKPVIGHGYKSFEARYMFYQAAYFKENPESKFTILADNVKHPFNEVMLLLLEFGIIGFLLLLFLTIFIVKVYIKNRNRETLTAASVLVGLIVFSFFSYPFKYPFSWLTVIFCIALFTFNMNTNKETDGILKQKLAKSALVLVSIFLLIYTTNQIYYEKKWTKIVNQTMLGKTKYVLPEYESLYIKMKNNSLFLYNYAAELNYIQHFEKSQQILTECQKSFNDYDVLMLSADNFLHVENLKEAENSLLLASYMCPNRFTPLYELAKIYERTNQMDKFIFYAQMIIDKKIKIPSIAIDDMQNEMRKKLKKFD